MGHVVRCLALANMLRDYFDVSFVLQETEESVYQWITQQGFRYTTLSRTTDYEIDCTNLLAVLNEKDRNTGVVVLDGYHFKTKYQQAIQQQGYKVIAIDDLHSWHHTANAIINHAPDVSPSTYDCEAHTRLLLGLDYALLRPEILDASRSKRIVKQAKIFLISMGAADESNCTAFFAQLLVTQLTQSALHRDSSACRNTSTDKNLPQSQHARAYGCLDANGCSDLSGQHHFH
jgi:spore coat polysaccharide biosynthesis predicted glycosyltransferase SpsG